MRVKFKKIGSSIMSICRTEFKRIFADKGVLIFFFGVQLSYPIIYPIPFYHQQVREIPIAVVDQDNSALSRQLLRYIDASEQTAIYKRYMTVEDAYRSFEYSKTYGVVVIPKDFEKNILRNLRAAVSLYTDASYFMIYRQVFQGVSQAAGTLSAGIEIKKIMAKFPPGLASAVRDPVPLESVPLYNRTGAYGSYLVPAVLVIILQQTLLIGIGMLGGTARENKSIHFLMQGVGRNEKMRIIILGKSLCYLTLYFIHIVYFFGILFKLYGYPQNAGIISVLVFFLPFLLAVIFLALTLSTVFRSRESSVMFLISTSIPFIMLSGISWPVESIPSWLRVFSLLVPTTSAIDGFMRLELMGAPFSAILSQWVTLWLLACFYFICALISFRRLHGLPFNFKIYE